MVKVPTSAVGLAVLLVACSATDEAGSHDAQPSPTTLEVTDVEVTSNHEDPSTGESPTEALAAGSGWDEQVRANFMDACLATSAGASGYCACTLEHFEERYTQQEFERLEQRLTADHPLPEDASQIIDACITKHPEEVAADPDGEWSQRSQAESLNACVGSSNGATEDCGGALAGMMERFSEDEFVEVSLAVDAGEPEPDGFNETVESCA